MYRSIQCYLQCFAGIVTRIAVELLILPISEDAESVIFSNFLVK